MWACMPVSVRVRAVCACACMCVCVLFKSAPVVCAKRSREMQIDCRQKPRINQCSHGVLLLDFTSFYCVQWSLAVCDGDGKK